MQTIHVREELPWIEARQRSLVLLHHDWSGVSHMALARLMACEAPVQEMCDAAGWTCELFVVDLRIRRDLELAVHEWLRPQRFGKDAHLETGDPWRVRFRKWWNSRPVSDMVLGTGSGPFLWCEWGRVRHLQLQGHLLSVDEIVVESGRVWAG